MYVAGYIVVETALSWDAAKTTCSAAGRQLASIKSAQENTDITSLLTLKYSTYVKSVFKPSYQYLYVYPVIDLHVYVLCRA